MAFVGYPRQPNVKVHLCTLIFSIFPTCCVYNLHFVRDCTLRELRASVRWGQDGPRYGQGKAKIGPSPPRDLEPKRACKLVQFKPGKRLHTSTKNSKFLKEVCKSKRLGAKMASRSVSIQAGASCFTPLLFFF